MESGLWPKVIDDGETPEDVGGGEQNGGMELSSLRNDGRKEVLGERA